MHSPHELEPRRLCSKVWANPTRASVAAAVVAVAEVLATEACNDFGGLSANLWECLMRERSLVKNNKAQQKYQIASKLLPFMLVSAILTVNPCGLTASIPPTTHFVRGSVDNEK